MNQPLAAELNCLPNIFDLDGIGFVDQVVMEDSEPQLYTVPAAF